MKLYPLYRKRPAALQPRLTICSLIAIIFVVGPTSGCKQKPITDDPRPTSDNVAILMVGPPAFDPQEPLLRAGAQHFAQARPMLEFTWETPAADTADARKVALERGLRKKPRAVVVWAEDAATAVEYRELLREAATLNFAVGPIPRPDGYQGHVQLNQPAAAELLAAFVRELADVRQSYVFVHRRAVGGWEGSSADRFESGLQDANEPHRLRASDASELASTRTAIDAALDEFPNASLVVTLEPSAWLERPRRALPSGCAFVTLGALPQLNANISDGSALAVAGCNLSEAGYKSLEIAFAAVVDSRITSEAVLIAPEIYTADSEANLQRDYADYGYKPDATDDGK